MFKCETCRHWNKRSVDPNNLMAPVTGECRATVPQLLVIPTQQGLMINPAYPVLPANFPACALHVARLEIT